MTKLSLLLPLCLLPVPTHAKSEARPPAPHESVVASVRAFQHNDLQKFLVTTLGEHEVAEMKATWNAARREKPDAEQSEQFRQFMEQLTAPDAEEMLFAAVEPRLEELEPQIAMMVGMFNGLGHSVIMEDESLTTAEKRNATRVLEAVGNLLMQNDVTDRERMHRAITLLCASARELDLHTLEDVHSLTFEQLLTKGGVAMAGVKDVLEVYGLTVDDWLETFHAETVVVKGDEATVRVRYTVLGLEQTSEFPMVRVEGRWIRKDAQTLTNG